MAGDGDVGHEDKGSTGASIFSLIGRTVFMGQLLHAQMKISCCEIQELATVKAPSSGNL